MIDTKFSKKKKSLCFFTHFFPSLSFPCVGITVSNARARETHTHTTPRFCLAPPNDDAAFLLLPNDDFTKKTTKKIK